MATDNVPPPLFVPDTRFEPYRIGTGRLLSLPVESRIVEQPAGLLNVREFLRSIRDVATALAVEECEVPQLVRRYHSGEDPSAAPITLMVFADISDKPSTTRRTLLRNINRHCWEAGLVDIEIEIMDIDNYWRTRDVPLRPNDMEVIQGWHELSLKVINYLDERRRSWTTMDLIRRGTSASPEECPVTLIIGTAESEEGFWWESGIRELENIAGVKVEIMHRTTWELNGDCAVTKEAYKDPPVMGASLGEEETRGGGTLGGFMQLMRRGGTKVKTYGLTNHHVAVKGERADTKAALDLFHEKKQYRPWMTSPSDDDHRQYLEEIYTNMSIMLDSLNNPNGMRERLDFLSSVEGTEKKQADFKRRIASAEAYFEELSRDLAHAEGWNRNIGWVEAASGRRTVAESPKTAPENFILDWAIIEMNTAFECENDFQAPAELSRDAIRKGVTTHLLPGAATSEFEIVNPWEADVQVGFRGRTSGWVFGELNGAKSLVNTIRQGSVAEKYGFSPSNPGYCWGMTQNYTARETPTAQGGDSGSVVLFNDKIRAGRWAGLLFGAGPTGMAYMTPIHLVLKDIEDVLDAEIVTPTLPVFE